MEMGINIEYSCSASQRNQVYALRKLICVAALRPGHAHHAYRMVPVPA